MAAAGESPSNAINALGTVLGYIGAEAATKATYVRLLWPQRAYYNLGVRNFIPLILLQPAGGPLYKAALECLDTAFKHGLFRGRDQGHMLGTSFFPDSGANYSVHGKDAQGLQYTELARNNLWARVMKSMPFPVNSPKSDDIEKPSIETKNLRARIAVRHLTLTVKGTGSNTNAAYMAVDDECKAFMPRCVLGVCIEEFTGLAVACGIVIVWQSWFAVLWILPLVLKLLSLAAALRRDSLDIAANDMISAKPQTFEVGIAPETGTFLVVTGPWALINQFFRHYGHPKRDRLRETILLGIVIISALLFPFGLLCSVAWMPLPVQYTWIAYQMYVVGAMYISRYVSMDTCGSTEEGIAKLLLESEGKSAARVWVDKANGKMVECTLESSFFSRYGQGTAHVQTLLHRS